MRVKKQKNWDIKRQFTVQAVSDSTMMALKVEDITKIYSEFPEIYAELFLSAYNRYKMTVRIKNQTIKRIEKIYKENQSDSDCFEDQKKRSFFGGKKLKKEENKRKAAIVNNPVAMKAIDEQSHEPSSSDDDDDSDSSGVSMDKERSLMNQMNNRMQNITKQKKSSKA